MKTFPLAATALLAATSVANADYVINDDLIVDGSACIGFDCVNGESFGFDTIRLKENNLRIKFDDTSTAASFPRNDWQITANDSANGGLSKFSIDDISGGRTPFTIEAGARSHSLYVDDGGRIGIRTSTPAVEVHVVDGDTPTLRLQQDGSSGFAPQTWDVAGNETNFFVRDVTNGSTLPFRIRPGAPSSSIFIDVDGDVGLSDSSPDANFDITRNGQVTMELQDSGGEAWQFVVDSTGSNDGISITRVGSGTREFRIDNSGNVYVAGTQVHPDYVFESNYTLMPLPELAEYVSQHKRLPGVQSAAEVQEHGLNLSAMQTELLKKVEELTLYTIQQDSTIKEQSRVVSERDARIAKLEDRLAVLEHIVSRIDNGAEITTQSSLAH